MGASCGSCSIWSKDKKPPGIDETEIRLEATPIAAPQVKGQVLDGDYFSEQDLANIVKVQTCVRRFNSLKHSRIENLHELTVIGKTITSQPGNERLSEEELTQRAVSMAVELLDANPCSLMVQNLEVELNKLGSFRWEPSEQVKNDEVDTLVSDSPSIIFCSRAFSVHWLWHFRTV